MKSGRKEQRPRPQSHAPAEAHLQENLEYLRPPNFALKRKALSERSEFAFLSFRF